jgi:serine/threonine protein kinase
LSGRLVPRLNLLSRGTTPFSSMIAHSQLATTYLPQTGALLDHYQLESLAACTVSAATFRGTDLRDGRSVAIKFLRQELLGNVSAEELLRYEEKIGRRLNHPGVVRFCFDEERSARYLVTEWLPGNTLRAILDSEGKLEVAHAVRLARRICEALSYVHSRGVVHRDLKPENIIVDSEDGIKLIDFGLATLGTANRRKLGNAADIVGTPDYISPEQVNGILGDARSDLYALGVILYEILTGATPFTGCNSLVIMHERLLSEPVPPRELCPDVPLRLQGIVLRALARDARWRYAAADELARDLSETGCVPCDRRPDHRPRLWPSWLSKLLPTFRRWGAPPARSN